MKPESEFYVGYLPMPAGVKQHIRRTVAALGAVVAIGAGILIAGQSAFPEASFEFQQYQIFQGTLLTLPYPSLSIEGQGAPWLLAGTGKHGVDIAGELDRRVVRVKGERILRGDDHMIEVAPNSIEAAGGAGFYETTVELGKVRLTGEIVDSKCYFGVMNPGNGKVHRDCATRCISGGIPPAFRVRDAGGRTMTLLLEHWNRELLEHIAEPVTIRGRLTRTAGRLALYAE